MTEREAQAHLAACYTVRGLQVAAIGAGFALAPWQGATPAILGGLAAFGLGYVMPERPPNL